MEPSTTETTATHTSSQSVVSDRERSVTIEPEPLWQENEIATQVPSQDSEDKSQRSTPSELTFSPMSPPDEDVSNNDTPPDSDQPTATSIKDYVDWYVNAFMTKEQRAFWDTPQILHFLDSVEVFKAKGQREINDGDGDTIEHIHIQTPTNTPCGATQ